MRLIVQKKEVDFSVLLTIQLSLYFLILHAYLIFENFGSMPKAEEPKLYVLYWCVYLPLSLIGVRILAIYGSQSLFSKCEHKLPLVFLLNSSFFFLISLRSRILNQFENHDLSSLNDLTKLFVYIAPLVCLTTFFLIPNRPNTLTIIK
jgi:hypothetical protein